MDYAGSSPEGFRVVVWFSCGAASAVAARLATQKYPAVTVVYCDTSRDEHPDNARFRRDVEQWIGQPVVTLASERYHSVDDVFKQRRYMSGPKGALCTVEMKKMPRFAFQRPDDVHVFGLTVDEGKRIGRFEGNNPELRLDWILREHGLTKPDCLAMLADAGIQIPAMYRLGFSNNNCIGCVKATSPKYWAKVRLHFPDVFAKRVSQSRAISCRLVRLEGQRRFLDEMPVGEVGLFDDEPDENVSCGPECGVSV